MKLALPKFTATQATVLVAVIGVLSAALVTVVSETLKSRAQTQLARSEFETKLIFRAIETSLTVEQRAKAFSTRDSSPIRKVRLKIL